MAKVRGSNPRASNQAGASHHDSRVNDSKGNKLETSCPSSLPGSEWEETRCPICMEFPHNAVLLMCSSHEKGCRPYMCDTSCRHSNCLDQFCKSSEVSSGPPIDGSVTRTCDDNGSEGESDRLSQSNESLRSLGAGLVCPLCRGLVFGFVVIEAARKYLNFKIRSCSLESCEFTGNYAELRKHARREHPSLRPSEADPKRQSDWVRLEQQTDLEDTLSAYHLPFVPDSTDEDLLLNTLVRLENHNMTTDVAALDYDWFDIFNGSTQLQNMTTNNPPVDDFLFDPFFYGSAFEAEDNVQSAVGTRTEDLVDAVDAEFAVSPFDDRMDDSSGNSAVEVSFALSHIDDFDNMFSRDYGNPAVIARNSAEEVEFAFAPTSDFSLLFPSRIASDNGVVEHDESAISRDDDSYPRIASNDNGVVESGSAISPIYFSLYGEALCPRDDYSNHGIASIDACDWDNGGLVDVRPTTTRRRRMSNNRREETMRPRRRARHMPYSSSRHSSEEER